MTGHELSAVTGFTYNLINPSTNYQSGIDWHLDWGASQFLTKQIQVGAVGYFYEQITPDRQALIAVGRHCKEGVCSVDSVSRISWRSWKRDSITHIGKPCNIGKRALKSETKSRVRNSAITA